MSKGPKFGVSLQNPQGANFATSGIPGTLDVTSVSLIAEDGLPSRGVLYRKRGTKPKIGVHLMHPRTDQTQNYNILPLASAGYAVLGRAGRWPNNDVSTIHEALLLDVAAGIRFLREQGCEKVVLLGNSGGSALAAFYQAQARQTPGSRLTATPAGDPFDLNVYDLPPADGVVFIGGHIGQGQLLAKFLDASVVDENDPIAAEPSLDLYDPTNGFRIPPQSSRYSEEFLTRYQAAQMARVRRLDARARQLIARQREDRARVQSGDQNAALQGERGARAGWHMIIYRTTANPAFVDLSIDPDDRIVFSYVSNRPDLENYGENGLARCLTPRAWLSTWSALSSKASTLDNLARFKDPFLVVHYAGDVGTRMGEAKEMLERSASLDKQLHVVRHADHYGFAIQSDGTLGPRSTEGTDKIVNWMRERFPL